MALFRDRAGFSPSRKWVRSVAEGWVRFASEVTIRAATRRKTNAETFSKTMICVDIERSRLGYRSTRVASSRVGKWLPSAIPRVASILAGKWLRSAKHRDRSTPQADGRDRIMGMVIAGSRDNR